MTKSILYRDDRIPAAYKSKRLPEKIMTKAFYKSFIKATNSLDAVEKATKEGNTTKAIENAGWQAQKNAGAGLSKLIKNIKI